MTVAPEGDDLPDVNAAREHVLSNARDLIARTRIDIVRDWMVCSFEIMDETGQRVLTMPFSNMIYLGWTDRQLFGVHPEHGTLRVDYCGALMVAGKKVHALEADRVVFERTTGYRNTPGKVWGPPIW